MNLGQGQSPRRQHPPVPAVPAYTLIAVGPPCTGKTSLLRLLLDTSPISPRATPEQLDSIAHFLTPANPLAFSECEVELLWADGPVLLRLIDTPSLNFQAEDDLNRTLRDILALIEDRYIEGARDRDDGESHVHLCLYVLDPEHIVPPSLNACEISAIRKLSTRVNVLPIIGRSEAITVESMIKMKRSVRANLAEAGLGFGIFDGDGDSALAPIAPITTTAPGSPSTFDDTTHLPLLPYAIFSPEKYSVPCTISRREIAARFNSRVAALVEDGHNHPSKSPLHPISDARSPTHDSKSPLSRSHTSRLNISPSHPNSPVYEEDPYLPRNTYTRHLRWGLVDGLDRRHSDFCALRMAVMACRNELKTYTKEHLYERFKVESLIAQRQQPLHSQQLSPRSQHHLPSHQLSPISSPRHTAYTQHPLERDRKKVNGAGLLHSPTDVNMDRDRDLARERDMGREREKDVVAHLSPLSREIIHSRPYPPAHVSPRNREVHPPLRDRDQDMHISPRDREREIISPRERERDMMHMSSHAHPREMHIPYHAHNAHPHPHSERSHHALPPPQLHAHAHALPSPASPLTMQHPHPLALASHPQQPLSAAYHHDPRSNTRLPPIRHPYDEEDVLRPPIQGVGREHGQVLAGGQDPVVGGQLRVPPQSGQRVMGLTANGRKRKITMACNFCRSRKLKCDGLRPACAQCIKRSNVCDYQPHTQAHSSSTSAASNSHSASSILQPPASTPTSASPQHATGPLASDKTTTMTTAATSQSSTTTASHVSTWRFTPKQRDSDVDELEDDGEDWGASPGHAGSAPGNGSGARGNAMTMATGNKASSAGTMTEGRKRVSVDMLIAETLGERDVGAGAGIEREREHHSRDKDKPDFDLDVELGDHINNNNPPSSHSSTPSLTPTPAAAAFSRNIGSDPSQSKLPSKTRIKSEDRERDRWQSGMNIIDVGCEGDKKKRLNRQSANYGSKAVACVHCRARKTRCDAARPACGNCARRSLACSYVHIAPAQPRAKARKEKMMPPKEHEFENGRADTSGGFNININTLNGGGHANSYALITSTIPRQQHVGVDMKNERQHDTLPESVMKNGIRKEDYNMNSNAYITARSVAASGGSDMPLERSVYTRNVDVDMDRGSRPAFVAEESAERERLVSEPRQQKPPSSSSSSPGRSRLHAMRTSSPPPIATLPVSEDTSPAPTPTHSTQTPLGGVSRSASEGPPGDDHNHQLEADKSRLGQAQIQVHSEPNSMNNNERRLGADVSDVRSGPKPESTTHVSPRSPTSRQSPPPPLQPTPAEATTPPVTAPSPPAPVSFMTNGDTPSINNNGVATNNNNVSATVNGKRKSPDTTSDGLDSSENRPDKKMKWMSDMPEDQQQTLREVRVQ